MDVYEAVARPHSDQFGHRLYDVYLMVDGKPFGNPVVQTLGHGEALRIAQALCEWQPKRPTGERHDAAHQGSTHLPR